MKLQISIELNNAAFCEDPRWEIAALLTDLVPKLDFICRDPVIIRDSNGNRIGFATIEE